jgi:hypothetical protein
MIVPLIVRGVRLYESQGGTNRDADTAAFDRHIVFEAAHQPYPGRLLDDHEAKTQPLRCLGPVARGRGDGIGSAAPLEALRHVAISAIRVTVPY